VVHFSEHENVVDRCLDGSSDSLNLNSKQPELKPKIHLAPTELLRYLIAASAICLFWKHLCAKASHTDSSSKQASENSFELVELFLTGGEGQRSSQINQDPLL